METSTPKHRDLRRLTLLNNANTLVSSPLRRKSSIAPNPTAALEPIDDEQERNARRSLVAMQKRSSNISTTTQTLLSESFQFVDENQLKDHLRICTKLYMENRISAKNAWQLQVIDVMRKISLTDNANVLQMAGSSLDIGTKVYSLRVDDVHTKVLQLASSMTKKNEKRANQENDEGENIEALDEAPKKKTARKRCKKLATDKRNVIDKEEQGLFATIKHVESVVFSTKENIDVCATDNLFTHKLPVNPATHQFMQMSNEKYWLMAPDDVLSSDRILENLEWPQIKHFSMCMAFKEFEIGNWNPEEEQRLLAEAHSFPDAVMDENGVPIAELDGSIHDIFEDDDVAEDPASDADDQAQEFFQAQIHGEIAHIVDAVPEEQRIETDYGYNTLVKSANGKYMDKIWAGPNHWKVKFNKRSSVRFSGSTVQQTVKHTKQRKVPQKIVFAPLKDDVCQTLKEYVIKRAPPTTSFEKITLPVPELYFANFDKCIDELFIKPGVKRPRLFLNANNNHQECEVQAYDYDNPNDSMYCSHNSVNNDEPMQNSFDGDMADTPQQMFLDDNLVDVPITVSTSQVPYAMQAKKMDMKKLKNTMWKRINKSDNPEDVPQKKINVVDFSSVYSDLPQLLSADMRKELTCPLAFVALLHLCNDNDLKLEKKLNSNDFTISKATE